MKTYIKNIVSGLVDFPDQVVINEVNGASITILEVSVAKSDVGKLIGRSGKTALAIRTLLNAVCAKDGKEHGGKRVLFNILED